MHKEQINWDLVNDFKKGLKQLKKGEVILC